jgi:hypothetical protein
MCAFLLALFTELVLSLFPTNGYHLWYSPVGGPLRTRLAATVLPSAAWDLALAASAASFLEKGMTEEQVEVVLGKTCDRVHMNSLGGFTVYSEYRLRLNFSYTGGGLLSVQFMRVEKSADREWLYRYLQELPLKSRHD